jgi:hypothetical protein
MKLIDLLPKLWIVGILSIASSAAAQEDEFDLKTQRILSEKELRRYGHTVTPIGLNSGKFLVHGGFEYVNHIPGDWTGTRSDPYVIDIFTGDKSSIPSSSWRDARVRHQSVVLGNGKIVLIGGTHDALDNLPILIFDPVSNELREKAGSRDCVRRLVSTTLLKDGTILIAGGLEEVESSKFEESDRACLYDPENGTFETLPSMTSRKYMHAATLLDDGRVLFSGGFNKEELYLTALEVFDPQSKQFKKIADMSKGRIEHTATRLPDGTVLIAGGKMDDHVFHKHVELFDPRSNSVTQTKNDFAPTRASHAAYLLSSGKVVFVGGYSLRKELPDEIDVFDPHTQEFSEVSHLSFPRYDLSIFEVSPGKILVSGGEGFVHFARKQELISRCPETVLLFTAS